MLIETLALAAAVTACDPAHLPGFGMRYHLANAGCAHVRQADSVHRDGFNGRLFVTRPVMGGVECPPAACESEAASYGAVDTGQVIYAQVGHLAIAISPWHRWNDESFPRHEGARQEWLREKGYVGGVRTFMNDANFPQGVHAAAPAPAEVTDVAQAPAPREIKPRAVFELSPEMTRFRSRMHVDAGRAIERAGGTTRVVTKVVVPTQVAAR